MNLIKLFFARHVCVCVEREEQRKHGRGLTDTHDIAAAFSFQDGTRQGTDGQGWRQAFLTRHAHPAERNRARETNMLVLEAPLSGS